MEFANFAAVIIPLATNTINKVMIAMDSGDSELFSSCFTETGTCTIQIANNTTHTGTAELQKLCKTLSEKFSGVRHWEGNVCLQEGEEGGLTNTSYWKAMNGGEVVSTGIHKDILECDGETCKIIERIIIHTWTKEGGHIDITTTP
jgi:hypothetical protein